MTGGAAAMQTNATAAIVNVVGRVIATVHITLSLPCGEQKGQNSIDSVLSTFAVWCRAKSVGRLPKAPPDPLPAGLTRERKARSHDQLSNENWF